jgi:hypothetical protein
MIKVEKIGQCWDVQIRCEDPAKEFALVAAAMMRVLPPEMMLSLIEGAKKMCPEVIDLNKEQNKIFFLRLAHLLEINRLNLKGLCQELQLPKEDCEDLKTGVIPSIEGIEKIAKRFGVSQDYLFNDHYGAK